MRRSLKFTPKEQSQLKICDLLENLKTVDECGRMSKVIDSHDEKWPHDKKFLKEVRNLLSDITFKIYLKRRS